MATPQLTPAQRKSRREQVRDVMQQIVAEIDGLDVDSMRALVPVLAAAEKEVAEKLGAFLSKQSGDTRFTTQQQRAALFSIRSAIDEITKLDTVAAGMLAAQRDKAAALAAKHVERELAAFGQIFEHTIRPVSIDVATVFARGDALLTHRFETSRARYQIGTRCAKDIEQQLAIGVASGESFEQLTRRLIRLGGPVGAVATQGLAVQPGSTVEQIGEGLFKRHEHFAERLVRSEGIEAYNQFADESIREASFEDPTIARRWDDTGDVRECPICRELRGCVVGVDQEFPGGIDHPPAHPNCRCAVVAWSSRWKEAADGVRFPYGTPQPPRTTGSGASKPVAPTQRPAPAAAPLPPAQPAHVFPTQPQPAHDVTELQRTRFETAPKPKAPPIEVPPALPSPEAFDVRKLAHEMQKTDPNSLGGDVQMPPSEQRAIRKQVALLIEDALPGIKNFDKGLREEHELQVVYMTNQHTTDGSVHINPGRYHHAASFAEAVSDGRQASAEFYAPGFKVLVHESLHGYSPQTPGSYHGIGAALEEASTETLARKIMRERFNIDIDETRAPLGSKPVETYDSLIIATRKVIEQRFGEPPLLAHARMEQAFIKMRSEGTAPIHDSHAYVAAFGRALGIPEEQLATSGSALFDSFVRELGLPLQEAWRESNR